MTTAVAVDATITTGPFTVEARFEAGPGITALFGPSGAGKSVTLAAIAGLLRPAAGWVAIDGEVVADTTRAVHVPTQQRRLGMVFQHAALLTHRSPLDNVGLAVRSGPSASRRQEARRWLDRVHAGHLAASRTATLSGGEQQRVALARALAGGPRLLLLDEPFSALDQPTRRNLRHLVRDLVDEQELAALVVTHDLADITAFADHVVLYEPGRTLGTHAVRRGHADDVAALLGLAP
ncbi:MAG TPA: ATP-binding cassette domain-containing protein [Acidimicrobiales bacterium]|nr:ATP-binding cassette domain-containing protein [Acidimicrobiales bacterium]